MERFVLYYQSQGVNPQVQAPEVLCVGTRAQCEGAKKALLSNALFRVIQLRDGCSGVLRIVPQGEGRSVVGREVAFHRSVPALGAVQAI